MKSIIKMAVISALIIILEVIAQLIPLSNDYAGIIVGVIGLIMLGMLASELFGFFTSKISNLFSRLLRKNKTSKNSH